MNFRINLSSSKKIPWGLYGNLIKLILVKLIIDFERMHRFAILNFFHLKLSSVKPCGFFLDSLGFFIMFIPRYLICKYNLLYNKI